MLAVNCLLRHWDTRIKILCRLLFVLLFATSSTQSIVSAEDFEIGPQDWTLERLQNASPGDRFLLRPGQYQMSWAIEGVVGSKDSPIVIASKDTETPARLTMNRGTLSIKKSDFLVLSGLQIDGQVSAIGMISLLIEDCEIKRSSGWRWYDQVVYLERVQHAELRNNTIESAGMHTYLLNATDCNALIIHRSRFQGKFQSGIRLGRSQITAKTMACEAGIQSCVVRGGDFAVSIEGLVNLSIRRSTLLNQNKGLFDLSGMQLGNQIAKTSLVITENLIVHDVDDLVEVVRSKANAPDVFDLAKSHRNIWYCTNRPRLNPGNTSLGILPDSIYGVVPSMKYLNGETFLDEGEIGRVGKSFERMLLSSRWSFFRYLIGLCVIASFVLGSLLRRSEDEAKPIPQPAQNFSSDEDTSIDGSGLRYISFIAFILALSVYCLARFVPFRIEGNRLISLQYWSERWASGHSSTSEVHLGILTLISFAISTLACLGKSHSVQGLSNAFWESTVFRSLSRGVGIALFCALLFFVVDVVDFFVFDGFSRPSVSRVVAILIGCLCSIVFSIFIQRVIRRLNFRGYRDFSQWKWLDIAAVFGVAFALTYAWYTSDIDINPRHMLAKLEGNSVEIVPFKTKDHVWDVFLLVWHGILVGCAFGRFSGRSRHGVRIAVGFCTLFWCLVEAVKLCMPSKMLSTDHFLWSLLGSMLGLIALPLLSRTPGLFIYQGERFFSRFAEILFGFSLILLVIWVDLGWYYFWYLTK